MNKTKISIVSYLNSKPFLYGLKNTPINNTIETSLDIPSESARKLKENKVDIGLIPVAAIKEINNSQIISDYCISSYQEVRTVVLVSNVPLSKIRNIYLDYHSRTSVMLTKVLAKFYWKKDFNWLPAMPDFEKTHIKNDTAGVIIGDRVFSIEKQYPYRYDLSMEWYNFTQLPFVFAAWVSNKKIDKSLQEHLNNAFEYGIKNIQTVIEEEKKNYPNIDIEDYLKNNINFHFNNKKRQALEQFLDLVKQL